MKKVFEIVSYVLSDIQKENEFLQASVKMQKEVLPKIQGYVGRKVLKNGQGKFCEIIMWTNLTAAKKAIEIVMKNKIFNDMVAFIDEKSIDMQHFEILSSSHKNLNFSAGAVEIGTTQLKDDADITKVVQHAVIVRDKYYKEQDGYVAQFAMQKTDGTYRELMFNRNDTSETEKICNGYYTDTYCLKYTSFFNHKTTDIQFWTIL